MRKLPTREISCQYCGKVFYVTKREPRTYCSKVCFFLKTTTHGEPDSSPEYKAWIAMKDRCLNPNTPHYRHYGGRGITVCPTWKHDFAQFLADMGRRPSSRHSLDRIDNALGYAPGNVRWATRIEQGQNRRNNHIISFHGISQCMSAWAAATGIQAMTIKARLKMGWTIEDTLMTPPRTRRRGYKHPQSHHTIEDVRAIRADYVQGMSVSALSQKYAVAKNTIAAIVKEMSWKETS
jgi:hypothetical protein